MFHQALLLILAGIMGSSAAAQHTLNVLARLQVSSARQLNLEARIESRGLAMTRKTLHKSSEFPAKPFEVSGPDQTEITVHQAATRDATLVLPPDVQSEQPTRVRVRRTPSKLTDDIHRDEDTAESLHATIERCARFHDVPVPLVYAVIHVESAFDPNAVSRAGACGLMQLMPGTARDMGVSDAFDPQENIAGGVKYLALMLERFNGDKELALAGYNAGPEAVRRHRGIPPYQETRAFVPRVLALEKEYEEQIGAAHNQPEGQSS